MSRISIKNKCKILSKTNGGNQLVYFVNTIGFSHILLSTLKLIPDVLLKFISEHNINIEIKFHHIEATYVRILQESFCDFKNITQYNIGTYFIDIFFPECNLAIECDENNHINYDKEIDDIRTKFIESHNIKILRFNPDESNFNIGKVIYRIMQILYTRKIEVFNNTIDNLQEKLKETKMCSTCRKILSVSEFHTNKSRSDGLEIRCKECRSEYALSTRTTKPYSAPPDTKECPECMIVQPSTNYWKNSQRKDGLNNICIECAKKHVEVKTAKEKVIPLEKSCFTCKVTKSIKNFGIRNRNLDGHTGVCKECSSIYLKNNRQKRKIRKEAELSNKI